VNSGASSRISSPDKSVMSSVAMPAVIGSEVHHRAGESFKWSFDSVPFHIRDAAMRANSNIIDVMHAEMKYSC
jgi:hypothetical protein